MRKLASLMCAMLALLGMTACGEIADVDSGAAQQLMTKAQEPAGISFDDYDSKRALREEYPISEEMVAAVNTFTAESAAELLGAENSCYSPISLYQALSLAAAGANGNTEQQFLLLLGASSGEELNVWGKTLYQRMFLNNEYASLKLANSLWLNDRAEFLPAFLEDAEQYYAAEVYSADFSSDSTGKAMGEWVARQTNGLLAPEMEVSPEMLLSLINTVYFADEWQDRFLEENTTPDTFTTAEGKAVEADFMHRGQLGGFWRTDRYLRAVLRTKSGAGVIFVLPNDGVSVKELISAPEDVSDLLNLNQESIYGRIEWSVPKFSFGSRYDLPDTLKKLGLTDAFAEGVADFSGISETESYIGLIKQETHIGINEEGIEAAAYTEIGWAGAVMPKDTAIMKLDRPFFYAVVYEGIPLFTGVVADPTMD